MLQTRVKRIISSLPWSDMTWHNLFLFLGWYGIFK